MNLSDNNVVFPMGPLTIQHYEGIIQFKYFGDQANSFRCEQPIYIMYINNISIYAQTKQFKKNARKKNKQQAGSIFFKNFGNALNKRIESQIKSAMSA